MPSLAKLKQRWQCHHHIVCCQYTDDGTCNSPGEKHFLGKIIYQWHWLRYEPRDWFRAKLGREKI